MKLSGGSHEHYLYVSAYNYQTFWLDQIGNKSITISSDERNGHMHDVIMTRTEINSVWYYHIEECKFADETDDTYMQNMCLDLHNKLDRE